MRATSRWFALFAVALGAVAAVAYGGDGPLAPKNLQVESLGDGAGVQADDGQWKAVPQGLTLVHPTLVRGHTRIHVVAGTFVDVPKGSIVRVSWEPAVRGWRFVAVSGDSIASFTNTTVTIAQGQSLTLTSAGDLFRGPGGYTPRAIGLSGLAEVSGFRPFENDPR